MLITLSFASLLHTKRSCCCTADRIMHSVAKPAKAGCCINYDLGYLLQKVQSSHCQPQKLLVLQMMVYVYDPGTVTFKLLPDMPIDLPQQIIAANEALCMVAAGNCSIFRSQLHSAVAHHLFHAPCTVKQNTAVAQHGAWQSNRQFEPMQAKPIARLPKYVT